jgi:hypothetical protein
MTIAGFERWKRVFFLLMHCFSHKTSTLSIHGTFVGNIWYSRREGGSVAETHSEHKYKQQGLSGENGSPVNQADLKQMMCEMVRYELQMLGFV